MSALAGIWNFDGRQDHVASCTRMLAVQSIYGPHDSSQWNAAGVALGRNLFQILPEDAYDNQPLVGGDGRFVLAADLRLDNRDDLIGDLLIPTEQARTAADSAILLAAWERWQENSFSHLVGVYAFALFDRQQQRLILARDPLGSRPLHYHRGNDFFAFASMPKGLHVLPEIPRQPDEQRIAEFLALMPESGSASFFSNVERVESGHYAIVRPTGIAHRRHWQPARKTLRLKDTDAYAEGLRHHLDLAVRSQLRGAERAVASHLSSGFDSSSVAATAAQIMRPNGGRVVAFTSVPREGYDGPAPHGRFGDEGPIAAATAAMHPNIDHVLVRPGSRTPLDNLDRQFFLYERPVLNLCNSVWSDAINDAVRDRKLNVLLTGQMGNMTISYDGMTLLPQLLASGHWGHLLREAVGLIRTGHRGWQSVLSATFGPYMPSVMWRWLLLAAGRRSLQSNSYTAIHPDRIRDLDLRKIAKERALDLDYKPRKDGHESRLWVMRRVDQGNWHKGTLAGWGIDQRDPTADLRLIEFCLSIPEEQLLSNGVLKALARRAFGDRLPPEVLHERRKGLQAIDWHEGLSAARQSLDREITSLQDCGPAATALDLERLRRLANDWPSGEWNSERVASSYRLALLRAISTGHFLRKALGSNA